MKQEYVVLQQGELIGQLAALFNDHLAAVAFVDYWHAETGAEYVILRVADRRV